MGLSDFVFAIFPGGAEVEIGIGRESDFGRIRNGPYQVLVDKKQLMEEVVFSAFEAERDENIEMLRRIWRRHMALATRLNWNG